MNPRRYRQLLVGSSAALLGLALAVWLITPSGSREGLPSPLESVFPIPGDTVVRQTVIEVDLPVGYSLQLDVDGVQIPAAEIGFTAGTGGYRWQPGPAKLFEVWEGGEHVITATWDRVAGGRPNPGQFSWTFRVI